VFKQVRIEVAGATKNQQTPWEASSLTGDFVFNLTVNVAPSATATGAPTDREALFWQSAQMSNRLDEYEEYLKQFPQGMFAGLARSRVAALKAQPQVAAAPAPSAVPSAVPAKPDIAVDPIDKEYVATQSARLREAPDVKSKQLATLKEGDTLLVLGKVKGQPWYQVERKGEAPAYVSAGLVEEAAAYKKRKEAETQQAMVAPTPAVPTPGVTPAPGRSFRDCPDCPEMVAIPAGSFTMGSPAGEAGRGNHEGPQHSVSVRGFALGKYEVTRGQFAAFVRETGYSAGGNCYGYTGDRWEESASRDWRSPGFSQSERDPVVCVSWDDAKAYAAWLSRKTGKSYRLPSEAEWEYAARAGSTAAWYWGEDASQACGYANVGDRAVKRQYSGWTLTVHECDDGQVNTAPVGSYRANGFGLHDMLGNVWEWTEDCWNKSYDGSPRDGSAWTSGDCNRRVLRGGSWGNPPRYVRSAYRGSATASNRSYIVGFRLARTN
jgi:formylglycine-generating enzyme required for sulfatase activity